MRGLQYLVYLRMPSRSMRDVPLSRSITSTRFELYWLRDQHEHTEAQGRRNDVSLRPINLTCVSKKGQDNFIEKGLEANLRLARGASHLCGRKMRGGFVVRTCRRVGRWPV